MRPFEAFFNMIDQEFWGMTFRDRNARDRKDSPEHDIARARQRAEQLKTTRAR